MINFRWRRRCAKLAALLSSALLPWPARAAAETVSPKPFESGALHEENGTTLYDVQWGPYRVAVVQAAGAWMQFRISDAQGQVLREIGAFSIDHVDYPDLSGRGLGEELRVEASQMDNTLRDRRTFCFSQRGPLRNVLTMVYGFDEVRRLGRSRRSILISDDPAPLEWAAGLCHGCCPWVRVVLTWNGDGYVIGNRRFPSTVRRAARAYRVEIEKAIRGLKNSGDSTVMTRSELLGLAIGYWANLRTIGEERIAQRWLLRRLPVYYRSDFLEDLPEIRDRLDALQNELWVSQERVVKLEDDGL